MDEIIIEEKRYISSKQAAKITGYAKDYIGQLCREGRVPARLVGRSWYVLEAAIQDHRFGAAAVEPDIQPVKESEIEAPLSAHMEKPRYEATSEEILPSLTDLEGPKTAPESHFEGEKTEEEAAGLEDSWHAWFERTDISQESTPEAVEEAVEAPVQEETEVNVPVRAIHHSFYKPLEEEELPRIVKNYAVVEQDKHDSIEEVRTYMPQRSMMAVQLVGVMIAAASVVVAIAGTGYFDSYLLTNRSISFVAGVSLYDK